MISIVAKFTINENEEANFLKLIKPLIVASQTEEACIEYALQKHTSASNIFCLIEKWKDQSAVDFHNNTPHFTETVPKLVELAKVEIDVYDAV